ncbi:MAG: D-alanyl-D-alanine carboxypeptidase family protein [Anaerovoracaceae bacterium]
MKKHMITKLFLLITVLILLAGCSPSISGDENNDSSSPGSDSQTTDTQEPDDQTASGSASAGIDMTGLPDPIDVRSSDDGGLLVLVNKLHTVSADYYPTDMVAVDGSLSTNQGLYFKREAYDAYLKMLSAAKADGINFLICSAYRSYDTQKSLYDSSLSAYGADFTYTRTAYPGRSEHHTGWAVDITSASMGYGLSQDFINYPEGQWINEHCSEYGFIIRYPEGKTHITGYDYEPWHLRYVGIDTAKEITGSGLTLEEYLGEA